MDSEEFCCEGNLFADLKSFSFMVDITPQHHKISLMDNVTAWDLLDVNILIVYKPVMLSLPSNNDLKSVLTLLSP